MAAAFLLARRQVSENAAPAPVSPATPAAPATRPSGSRAASPAPPVELPVTPQPIQKTSNNEVRVTSEHVFATVNGVPIRGGDLMLFGKEKSAREFSMAPEQYDLLLQRAVHRELIFQLAKKEKIELNADQNFQLEKVREMVKAREGGDPNAVFLSAQGTIEEQIAFEVREAEALLLQNSLLQKQGISPPFVTEEQVRAQYESNKATYGELPEDPAAREAAWQKIDYQIREELTPQIQSRYREQLEAFTTSIESAAAIQTAPPES